MNKEQMAEQLSQQILSELDQVEKIQGGPVEWELQGWNRWSLGSDSLVGQFFLGMNWGKDQQPD